MVTTLNVTAVQLKLDFFPSSSQVEVMAKQMTIVIKTDKISDQE